MFNPGCCCIDCPTIGFDQSAWGAVTSCCSGMSPIINLASDVSRLSECRVVFCGNVNQCAADAVRFDVIDWPAVKSYIESGGRIWINGEFEGCLGDPSDFSSFLAAMGSSITWAGGVYDQNCAEDGSRDCTPGSANIAQSLSTPFRMAATAEMSGGATVWYSPSGKSMVQVEQLGDGFLFASGDSNNAGASPCNYNHCEFWRRLWEYGDADIV